MGQGVGEPRTTDPLFLPNSRERRQKVIDRQKLHAFVDRRCDEIEAEGD